MLLISLIIPIVLFGIFPNVILDTLHVSVTTLLYNIVPTTPLSELSLAFSFLIVPLMGGKLQSPSWTQRGPRWAGSKPKVNPIGVRAINRTILAIALLSLRISPLLWIAAIVLFYTAILLFNVVYIQSIGSVIDIYSGLFYDVQGSNAGSIIIGPLIDPMAIVLFSLVPVKPADAKPSRGLTGAENSQLTLSDELRQILTNLRLVTPCENYFLRTNK
jgi:hypothetical protein